MDYFESRKENIAFELVSLEQNGVITRKQREAITSILNGNPMSIEVQTPFGTIKATEGTDSEYPGVDVVFCMLNGEERPAAVVECNGVEDPDAEVRVVVYGAKGNHGEDLAPTGVYDIYSKSDLDALKIVKLSKEEQELVNLLNGGNGDYEIVCGGEKGNIVIQDHHNGSIYTVSVKKL